MARHSFDTAPSDVSTIDLRRKMAEKKNPYWRNVETGISLGYWKFEHRRAWKVRVTKTIGGKTVTREEVFGKADDNSVANGTTVFSHRQAVVEAARRGRVILNSLNQLHSAPTPPALMKANGATHSPPAAPAAPARSPDLLNLSTLPNFIVGFGDVVHGVRAALDAVNNNDLDALDIATAFLFKAGAKFEMIVADHAAPHGGKGVEAAINAAASQPTEDDEGPILPPRTEGN